MKIAIHAKALEAYQKLGHALMVEDVSKHFLEQHTK